MEDLYFSTNLDDELVLCIAPLTDRNAMAASPTVQRNSMGYFLYEAGADGAPDKVKIIARLVSEEAAVHLSQLLKMA